jgi:transmembrane sensor
MQRNSDSRETRYKNLIKIIDGKASGEILKEGIYKSFINKLYSILSKNEPDYEQILARIEEKLVLQEEAKRRYRHRRFLYYAAGVAAILIAVFNIGTIIDTLFVSQKKQEIISTIAQVPKRHKATLIINDSSLINIEKDSVTYSGNHMDPSIVSRIAQLQKPESINDQIHTLVIPKGGEFFLTLPDGTQVYLNSNSKLTYPCKFSDSVREVFLEGEALFNVKHSGKTPFIVRTGRSMTRVLGTRFNVRSDTLCDQVTLCHGSVEVQNLATNVIKGIIPDEQATIIDNAININMVDSYEISAWTEGKFYFKNKPLSEITARLYEWYNVDFRFKANSIKSISFTGMINRNDPLKKIFDLFESSYNINFQVNDFGILIMEN